MQKRPLRNITGRTLVWQNYLLQLPFTPKSRYSSRNDQRGNDTARCGPCALSLPSSDHRGAGAGSLNMLAVGKPPTVFRFVASALEALKQFHIWQMLNGMYFLYMNVENAELHPAIKKVADTLQAETPRHAKHRQPET